MSAESAPAASADVEQTPPHREAPIAVGALNAELPVTGGIQRFTVAVLREMMAREPRLLAYAASEALFTELGTRGRNAWPRTLSRASSTGNLMRFAWHLTVLPRRLRGERAAVYYSTVPDGMLVPACAQVVTVHDVIPLRFPASSPRLKHYFRHVLPRIIGASEAVIAMSEATRQDLHDFYGVESARVHVVHQGFQEDIFRPAPAAGAVSRLRESLGVVRYLLAVGEGRPYKNIPRLLEAWARLRPKGVALVLAGRANSREVDLPSLAAALGVSEAVRFLGYVPDEQLAALYAGAEGFVFPSLYEGFGIPPLEAMACGCPVVASDRASIPEVCGEAAVYVDPESVDSLAEGMERVLGDEELRASLREAGMRRANGFSYARAAEQILAVLRPLAARAGSA